MFIRDPAGLLHRIPELRVLCEDARVRRAVERGDPFKLYRTLKWARWLGRLRSHRQVLKVLLGQRRLFARPLKGNGPQLGTLNGFGAALLGGAEPDAVDGTVIVTHSVVGLFFVPLFPLGAYVVRRHDSGWTVFARVPLGTLSWLWTRLVSLAVMALVVGGAGQALHASRYREVHLGNAFAQPLEVTLGGVSRTVAAGAVTTLTVPVGRQHGRAVSQSGMEVDVVDLDVQPGGGLLMWNIAGGMPVLLAQVLYASPEELKEDGPAPTVFCGQQVIQLGDVDYLFTDPPESLSMREDQGRMVKSLVKVARKEGDLLSTCFVYLGAWNRLGEALPFTEAAARLSGWAESESQRAVRAASSRSSGEAVRISRAMRDAKPEALDWHRTYQWAVEMDGGREALLSEYESRASKAPESPDAQYLYVRLKRGPEGSLATEMMAKRFPEHAELLRSVVHRRYLAGSWEGTREGWERLVALDETAALEVLEEAMTAFVALGREAEALARLTRMFDGAREARVRSQIAEVYALVAARTGRRDADALVAKFEAEEKGERLDWLRARAHLQVTSDSATSGVRLMAVVGRSPTDALRAAESVSDLEMSILSEGAWALAYTESVRIGASECQRSLERFPLIAPSQRADLQRFIQGELASLESSELSWEIRAAAAFVRSRDAKLPEAERKRWVEQARKADWFHGVVSEAITSWTL
ncbi:hypothetical protein LZ198_30475 [Myxococcus sp. K15C18031901]|uniref:hypothetical protein n=1 Tax=Myxococcus dinghuensis TaxID=2906761 RepID=UPI0020A7E8EA|nr:hypothetical protein [Myxococcus dinghuensis]MCP3103215.1 hypothetical protein [Myxococcus dinghuensis]